MSRVKDILPQGGWPTGRMQILSGTSLRGKIKPGPWVKALLAMDFSAIETRIETQLAEGVEIKQDGKFVPLDVTAIRTARLRGPKSHF